MTTIVVIALVGLILICSINTVALVHIISKYYDPDSPKVTAKTPQKASLNEPNSSEPSSAPAPSVKHAAPEISEEEMAKARKQFQAEMEAFQELMNYNQEKAYGIEPKE